MPASELMKFKIKAEALFAIAERFIDQAELVISALITEKNSIDPKKDMGIKLISEYDELIEQFQNLKKNEHYLRIEECNTLFNGNPQPTILDPTSHFTQAGNAIINFRDDFIKLKEQSDVLKSRITPQILLKRSAAVKTTSSHSHTINQHDQTEEENDSDSEEELSPEIIKKVQKRLEEINRPLAKKFKASWKKYKTKKEDATEFGFLNTIVNMPGYGHIPGSDYVYLTQEEINSKLMYARQVIDDAKLAGTEYITDTIIKAYGTFLQTMLANESEGQHPGDVIPLHLIKERMPVFCVYGPPGTGKTTLAALIARAIGLGFVNVSMDTVQAASDLVGLPKSYAGGGAPSVMVQGMIDTGTELNLVFYDEIEKADKSSVQALRQQIDVDKDSYQDNYLATQIAKGKNIPLIAANNISELPSHIRSRIIPIYFPGYDDKEKYNILRNMVIKKLTGLGHRHKYIKFQTSDPNDLNREYKTGEQDKFGNDIMGNFSGFILPSNDSVGEDLVHPDTIKYIIDNYVIEAGVREAGAMLDRIISEASARYQRNGGTANIVVNTELVRAALKDPDPNIKVIKELEQSLGSQTKEFNTAKGALSEILDRNSKNIKDPSKISASDKNDLTKSLEIFIEASESLINSEKEMIERLKSQEISEALQVRIKAHTNFIETFTKTTETLRKRAESLIGKKSTEEIKADKETKNESDTTISPPFTHPNDESSKKFAEMEKQIKLLQNLLSSQTVHNPSQSITEEQRKEFESARNELANLHRELVIELKLLKTQNAPSSIAGSGIIDPLLQSKLQHIDALQHQVTELNTLVQQALSAAKQTPVISTSTMFNPNMEGNNNAFLEQRLSIAEDRISDLKKLLAQGNVSNFPQMISEFPFSDNFINSSEHSPEMDELFKINRRLDTEIQQLRENGRPADKSNMLLLQKVLNEKLNEIEQLRQKLLEKDEELLQQKDKTHQENQINIDTTDESEIDEQSNHTQYSGSSDNKPYVEPKKFRRWLSTQQKTPSQIKVSTKPPITTRHVPTPQEAATFGARVGKMQLGYDIIKMLEKKSRKQPAVVVAAAFNKKELLNKFNEFCASVSEKIERYNDDELVGAVQQLNDIIQSKPNEAEKEKILAKKLNTEKLGPLLYRDPDKNTENPLQRFENKTNSVAVYNGLQAKRDPENKLTILKPDDDYPEPIVTISHEKPIDGPNFVEIICANTYPEDRDIFVTINSARKLSKDGRFTVVGCDRPPNPDAAMKLFIYGLSIGLKPRLLPATRKMIEEKRGDEHLFKIFTKHQDEGLGVVSQNVRNAIVEDLKTYDNQKKKVVLRKL